MAARSAVVGPGLGRYKDEKVHREATVGSEVFGEAGQSVWDRGAAGQYADEKVYNETAGSKLFGGPRQYIRDKGAGVDAQIRKSTVFCIIHGGSG
jgi:hypothetical protein